jgi:transposase
LVRVRKARSLRAASWRITHFLDWAYAMVGNTPRLEPMHKSLATQKSQFDRVVQRWTSPCTNARLEGFNDSFQAALAQALGHRNNDTFIIMIHLIGSPAGTTLKSA